jgi:integrase
MADKLFDATVKKLARPERGNRIYYDTEVTGFGCRVTAAGARSFVLNYRTTSGRERRYTIGAFPDWTTTAARTEAKRLKLEIRANGHDPVGALEEVRGAPTVADLCDRYITEHLPKKRASSVAEDRSQINQYILPELRHHRVAEIGFADIDALHRKITRGGTPYRANRALALLSKMFSLSIRWRWRSDNPCRGVERNQEHKRVRYLSPEELGRLSAALTACSDQQAANAIRLLLLTGARRGEVLSAKWSDFNFETGEWTKPGAATKQKTEHRVPLSAPARQLLAGMPRSGEHLFPGPGVTGCRVDLNKPWASVCKTAGLRGVRVHDLRHTYASVLASAGLSLHTIGALLGHAQPATTARYAHLTHDSLKSATETAGAIISGAASGDIVPLKGAR